MDIVTLEQIKSDISEYRSLLDSRVRENKVQEFLASHSYFFHTLLIDVVYPYPVFSKVRLGTEYETDFVGVIPSSFGPEWRLAEIESPKQCMFTDGGDPSAPLNHAIQQVRNWIRWCEDNISYAQRLMTGLKYPLGIVFCGRRSELTPATQDKLRQLNRNPDIRIRTLDALIDGARAVEHFAKNGSVELDIPINTLSHVEPEHLPEETRERLGYPIRDELSRRRLEPRIWDYHE
ncbi:MAG: Shedu anti-phage system protein SduA domain-containing protein [Candidatus Binatus sp.]|uniref:Shedu anti-phage system protein SduA domain-containing protein n=1 Tax=Candidatus Binatus sp. TaxID=2811406 RepID=UPI003C724663